MLDFNDRQENKRILVDQQPIETDFIDDPTYGLSITFPPVNSLVGKPDVRPRYMGKSTEIQFGHERSNEEFRKLLKLQDRFKQSVVYKTRLSELAKFCGDSESAVKYANEALELNPENADSKYRLGEKLFENNQSKESYKIFINLSNEHHSFATLRLAEYEVSRNRLDKALEYAQKIAIQDTRDWRANLLIGTIYLTKGDYGRSIRFLRKASIYRPNLSTIYLNKGLAYYLTGKPKRAVQEAKKALSLNPSNRSALTLLTDISFRDSIELESSKYYLDKYYAFSGSSKDLIDRLSNYFYKKGDRKEGIKLLESAKDTYRAPDILNNLGVFWIDKNPDKAARYFYDAIESIGGISKAHESNAAEYALVNLARILLDHNKIDECLALIDEYLNQVGFSRVSDEEISRLYIVKVWCYFRKSRDEEALQILHQLECQENVAVNVLLDTLSILTSYEIIKNYDFETSLTYANKAYEVSLDRKDLEDAKRNMALNNLIFVYLEADQIERAKQLIGKLRFDLVKSEYAYATLGLLNLKIENIEAGKHYYELAIGKSNAGVTKLLFRQKLYFELGKYYISKGLSSKAKSNLKKVIKIGVIRSNWEIETYYHKAEKLLANL